MSYAIQLDRGPTYTYTFSYSCVRRLNYGANGSIRTKTATRLHSARSSENGIIVCATECSIPYLVCE